MGRAAEAVESYGRAGAHLGAFDRPIADDSRTQQRRDLGVGHDGGQRVRKVLAHRGELRVAAIAVPAGEARIRAEVLAPAPAISARATGLAQPRDSDAVARRKAFASRTQPLDHADHLVPGNDTRMFRREVALAYVEIGAAYAAGGHANEDLAGRWRGRRQVGRHERTTLDCRRSMYHHRTHRLLF